MKRWIIEQSTGFRRSQLVNLFGLVLGMIGCMILFYRSYPQPSFEPFIGYVWGVPNDDPKNNEEVRKLEAEYKRSSYFGLGLIFASFGFQFVAVWMEKPKRLPKEPDSPIS